MQKKPFVGAVVVLCALVLSACGQSEGQVVRDTQTKVTTKTEPSSNDVDTLVDEKTGEVYDENDGPIDPKTLQIKDADPRRVVIGCADEVTPVILDRLAWDYDGDGAADAVVVSKCATTEEYNVTIMRATSRGWWPKRNFGPEMKIIAIKGGCKLVGEPAASVMCDAERKNPVNNKVEDGKVNLLLVQGNWDAQFI